jgi:hypothetical protein
MEPWRLVALRVFEVISLAGDFQSFQNLESATISGLRAAERLLRSRIVG